ncbi:MAG TPA: MFS transporter, partial [Deferrisomatales bacterium]|nr:MFS transporter [Deferrisomatales bacterium]
SFLLTSRAGAVWQLFVTYSLLLSLGTGAIYGVVNTTTSRWFLERRGVAVGITSSGGGVGAIVIAPFATFLIAHYQWRTAFVVMGGIAAAAMIGAALLLIKDPGDAGCVPDGGPRRPPGKTSEAPADQGRQGLTLRQAFAVRPFWLLAAAWFLLSLSLHMVFIHVVPYAVGMGVSLIDASLILSLMGLANILGRLVLGRLCDRVGPGALGVVCLLVQCGALLWLMVANQLWMLYLFGAVYGFLWGGAGTITTVLTVELFGTRSLGTIMGVMSGGWAMGAAAGPAIGGYVFDVSGHYVTAFGTGAAALFTAAGLLAILSRGARARVAPC